MEGEDEMPNYHHRNWEVSISLCLSRQSTKTRHSNFCILLTVKIMV
jgi:preprotein translocase subunit SecB